MSDTSDGETERGGGLALGRSLQVIRRRRWIVLGMLAAAIAAAALFSLLQRSVYSAEAKIVIGQGNTLFQPQNGNVIQPFTATMADLVMSDIVARDVIATLGLATTPSSLLGNVSVSTNPQTAVLQLTVDAHSPQLARSIASQFSIAFVHLVQSRFGKGHAGLNGTQNESPITAVVFDPAHIVPGKVAPKLAQNLVVAAALGIVLGLVATFFVEQMDGTLRTEESIEALLGIPVIGRVPVRSLERLGDRRAVWDEETGVAEAYRTLRAILSSRAPESGARTLLVSSATERQGKEAVSANLARAIADTGTRTLLIEGDLRQRLLDGVLDSRPPGLTRVLTGDASLGRAVRRILASPVANGAVAMPLDFLPSGANGPDLVELLSSEPMLELLGASAEQYASVLIDGAPLLLVADALRLAHVVDGVLLVVGQDQLHANEAKELRFLFERLGAHPLGVVVTYLKTPRRRGQRSGPLTDQIDPAFEPESERTVAAAGVKGR
jgi:capsular exopolysaccharide synthesis family protein